MVEFALVGSILFILVFGIIDFGRAIQDASDRGGRGESKGSASAGHHAPSANSPN